MIELGELAALVARLKEEGLDIVHADDGRALLSRVLAADPSGLTADEFARAFQALKGKR